jgi:hypothetical protein
VKVQYQRQTSRLIDYIGGGTSNVAIIADGLTQSHDSSVVRSFRAFETRRCNSSGGDISR